MDSESKTIEIIRSIQLAIIVPINLIGNTLVCLVIYRIPQLQTPMNYLLVNLAISDIVVALFMTADQPFFYGWEHPSGTTGDYLCKFITGKIFSWVGSVASVFTLVALVFERYYAIVHPLRSRAHITRKQFYTIITSCWTFAVCFNIPLIVVRIYNTNVAATGYFCRSNWSSIDIAIAYNFIWLFFIGILPIAVMGFLYGLIARSLWGSGNRVSSEQFTSQVRFKARKRVTKMLITITIIFALCWMPNLLINVISYYYTPTGIFSYGYLITEVLVLLNSSINPFVYGIQSKQFRNGIKAILCCKWCPRRNIQVQSNEENKLEVANMRSPRVSMVTGGFAN